MEKPKPQSQTERFLITSKELSCGLCFTWSLFFIYFLTQILLLLVSLRYILPGFIQFNIILLLCFIFYEISVTCCFLGVWQGICQGLSPKLTHKTSPISVFKKRKTQNWKGPGSWATLLFVLSTFDPKTSGEERPCKPPKQQAEWSRCLLCSQFPPRGGPQSVTSPFATRNLGTLTPLF